MTKDFMDKMNELDKAAEKAGGYVAFNPGSADEPQYNYRDLSRYAREKGVEPFKLTEEERERFRIN